MHTRDQANKATSDMTLEIERTPAPHEVDNQQRTPPKPKIKNKQDLNFI